MGRRTNYIVFVDKSELDDPDALFDAAISHLIKKDCDPMQRKRFIAQFTRAYSKAEKMAVVKEWVQVRDAATYPWRNRTKKAIAEEEEARIAVEEAEEQDAINEDWKQQGGPVDVTTDAGAEIVNKAAEKVLERSTDEDKGVEGGVSVDDGADGEPESRDTSE